MIIQTNVMMAVSVRFNFKPTELEVKIDNVVTDLPDHLVSIPMPGQGWDVLSFREIRDHVRRHLRYPGFAWPIAAVIARELGVIPRGKRYDLPPVAEMPEPLINPDLPFEPAAFQAAVPPPTVQSHVVLASRQIAESILAGQKAERTF